MPKHHCSYYSDIQDEGQIVADAQPTGEGSMPLLGSGSAGMFIFFQGETCINYRANTECEGR